MRLQIEKMLAILIKEYKRRIKGRFPGTGGQHLIWIKKQLGAQDFCFGLKRSIKSNNQAQGHW